MRTLNSGLVFAFALLLSSCFDITETIVVEKNGSGQYALLFDMSNMLKDPMMSAMLKASEGETKMPDKDTTIYFNSLQDSVPAEYRAAVQKMTMRMVSHEKDSVLTITIAYPFDNTDDLNTMFKALEEVGKREGENGALGMLGGGQGLATGGVKFASGKKQFIRTADLPAADNPMAEQMDMMKMMMGDASYKLVYTMPGKIKKTTIPNATIAGDRLTATASMLDLMERKVNLSGELRYK